MYSCDAELREIAIQGKGGNDRTTNGHELVPEVDRVRCGQAADEGRDLAERLLVLDGRPSSDGVEVLNDDAHAVEEHFDGVSLSRETRDDCDATGNPGSATAPPFHTFPRDTRTAGLRPGPTGGRLRGVIDGDALCFPGLDLVRRLDEHDLGFVVDEFDDGLVDGDGEVLGVANAGKLEEEGGFVVLEELSGSAECQSWVLGARGGARTCLWSAMSSGAGASPTEYQPRKSNVGKTCRTASSKRRVSSLPLCESSSGTDTDPSW